jgi:hypothetical protein
MFPFETSPCRGLLLFPGLPPAKGYLSFETPLAIGKSELTRSELETSRVVSTWIELAASKVRSLLGAATLLNLHAVRFSLSESREVLLGGVSWCANPSRLPLRVTHLRDFILPLAGGAYSETEQTCREELTRSGRTLDLHTSCLLTKATSGYTDLIWRNASGVFTAPFRSSPRRSLVFETSPVRHSSLRLHTATGRRSLLGE